MERAEAYTYYIYLRFSMDFALLVCDFSWSQPKSRGAGDIVLFFLAEKNYNRSTNVCTISV